MLTPSVKDAVVPESGSESKSHSSYRWPPANQMDQSRKSQKQHFTVENSKSLLLKYNLRQNQQFLYVVL
jgi:hypothetical protein